MSEAAKIFDLLSDSNPNQAPPARNLRQDHDDVLRQQSREAVERKLAAAAEYIPKGFRWATFDAPELSKRVTNQRAIDDAKAAVGERGVVLSGNAGSGKTTLACCMLRAIIATAENEPNTHTAIAKRAFGVRFIGAYWVAKARHEHRLGEGEAPLVEEAMRASVLVLDDLGIEQAKNSAVSEVIYERHANELPTIVTTGFSFPQLVKMYGDGIARRITEHATIIKCQAGNGR